MLSLEQAREFYSPDELCDEELMELVKEIDCIQCRILDEIMPSEFVQKNGELVGCRANLAD